MESTLGIEHAARLLGITVKTLQRWEREGRLVPAPPRRIVAYCRVSCAAQRPDLVNQRHVRKQLAAARGLAGGQLHAALEGNHAAGTPDQD